MIRRPTASKERHCLDVWQMYCDVLSDSLLRIAQCKKVRFSRCLRTKKNRTRTENWSRDPADDTQEPLRYQLFEFAKYTVIALSHTVSTSPSLVA